GGFLDLPRLGAVTCQQLGLVLGDLQELSFEGFGDSGMKRTSRLAQQRAVSNVPYQCMLEKVGRVRRAILPEQQTSPNETVKPRLQLRPRARQGMGDPGAHPPPDRRRPRGRPADRTGPRQEGGMQAGGAP